MTSLSSADLQRTQTSTLAGTWVALQGPGVWALVDAAPQAPVVARLVELIGSDPTVNAMLEALLGGGFAELPPFALARVAADERRIVVRGPAIGYLYGTEMRTVWAHASTAWEDMILDDDLEELVLTSGDLAPAPPWAPSPNRGVNIGPAAALRLTLQPAIDPAGFAPSAEPPALDEASDAEPAAEPQPDPVHDQDGEQEGGPSYDFLWGATQRGADLPKLTSEEVDALVAQSTEAAAPGARTLDTTILPGDLDAVAEREHDLHATPPIVEAATVVAPAAQAAPSTTGLIEAVPWLVGATGEPHAALQAAPVATPAPLTFEPAVPAPTAVTPAAFEPAAPPTPSPAGIAPTLSNLAPSTAAPPPPVRVDTYPSAEIQQTVNRAALAAAAGDIPIGPTVLAAYCPHGHLTPAFGPVCRVCAKPVPTQDAREVPRPILGVLRLSTGDTITLDRGVVIGRAPEALAAQSPERPNVMRLVSPHNDLSRNHAEIVLDGWNVYVRDLDSTNGTTVTLPGQEPVRLRANDLFLLEPSAVVNLADEVNVLFEVSG